MLGKTFTERRRSPRSAGSTANGGRPLLAALVRKEVLSLQTDPRSPEHGQYGFLQDLVREVAYETLSRRDRAHATSRRRRTSTRASVRTRVGEVIAAHYVAAYEAAPDAEDAARSAKAQEALDRAATSGRARRLG